MVRKLVYQALGNVERALRAYDVPSLLKNDTVSAAHASASGSVGSCVCE